MKRGSIYWVNLEPAHPPEFGKTRPCLVLSNSEQNEILLSVVVVPLSSKAPEIWPLRLEVKVNKNRSYLIIPGIRQIAKKRILDFIASLSVDDLIRVEEALNTYLSD